MWVAGRGVRRGRPGCPGRPSTGRRARAHGRWRGAGRSWAPSTDARVRTVWRQLRGGTGRAPRPSRGHGGRSVSTVAFQTGEPKTQSPKAELPSPGAVCIRFQQRRQARGRGARTGGKSWPGRARGPGQAQERGLAHRGTGPEVRLRRGGPASLALRVGGPWLPMARLTIFPLCNCEK